MTTNIPTDEEMLGYLRERSTNYPGTNHGADGVSAWALAEIDRLRAALSELGGHVFGGGWVDHGAGCEVGTTVDSCTCGLTEWLKKYGALLGIALDVAADLCHTARSERKIPAGPAQKAAPTDPRDPRTTSDE